MATCLLFARLRGRRHFFLGALFTSFQQPISTVNAKAEILTGSWVDDLSRISGFVEKISSSLTAITLLLSSPVGCLVETFWRDPGTPLDAKRIGVEMTLRIYTIGMGRRS